jgi:hypothetical protein
MPDNQIFNITLFHKTNQSAPCSGGVLWDTFTPQTEIILKFLKNSWILKKQLTFKIDPKEITQIFLPY